jgi:hypothetical protein
MRRIFEKALSHNLHPIRTVLCLCCEPFRRRKLIVVGIMLARDFLDPEHL